MQRPRALLLLLWLSYAALVVFVSLTPFSPWRDWREFDPAFLLAPLPRFITAFDILINVLAYMPLGWLAACLLRRTLRPWSCVLLSCLLGALLSLVMELLQSLLPPRIPSNLDLLTNSLGAFLGALPWRWPARCVALLQPLETWRGRWLLPGAGSEIGICLLVLWSASQLNPSIPFLGAGVLRNPYIDAWFESGTDPSDWALQTLAAALITLGLGGFLASLLREHRAAPALCLFWLVSVMAAKATMGEFLLRPLLALAWFGSATLAGLSLGTFCQVMTRTWPRTWLALLSGVCLLSGGVIAKLASHYVPISTLRKLFGWNFGQLLSFTGLTVWLNETWPLLAVFFLVLWWPQMRAAARELTGVP